MGLTLTIYTDVSHRAGRLYIATVMRLTLTIETDVSHRTRRLCIATVIRLTLTIYTQNSVNIKKPSYDIFNVSCEIIEFVF